MPEKNMREMSDEEIDQWLADGYREMIQRYAVWDCWALPGKPELLGEEKENDG